MANQLIFALLTIALSAYAFYIGIYGGVYGSFLIWVAPLPLLLYAFYSDLVFSFIVSFLGFYLGKATAFWYLARLLPADLQQIYPLHSILMSAAGDALAFALAVLLTRWAVFRSRHWVCVFLFPALWTSYEFLSSQFYATGTKASFAYTQVDWASLIQIVSFAGIWSVTFVLFLIPAGIAIAYFLRADRYQAAISIILPFYVLLVTLSYGQFRLHQLNSLPPITVGMVVVPETIQDLQVTDKKAVLAIIDKYINQVVPLAKEGDHIILFPEKMVTATKNVLPAVLDKLTSAAKQNRVFLIAGINQPDEKQDMAYVISQDGKILLKYAKQNLVTGQGTRQSPGLFYYDENLLGVAISNDMDFVEAGRGYSNAGAGVVFVPALDLITNDWLHARIAIMRGLEGGFSVVRTAQWGLLTASNGHGVILDRAIAWNHLSVLSADVTIGTGKSLYASWGNWFPWATLLLSVGILVGIWSKEDLN